MAHSAWMILWMTPIAATALNVPAVGAERLADAQLAQTMAGAIGSGNGNGNGNIGNNNGNGNSGNNNGNGNAGSNNGNGNSTSNNGNGAGGLNTAPHFAPNAAWIAGLRHGGAFPGPAGQAPGSWFTLNGYHGFIPR